MPSDSTHRRFSSSTLPICLLAGLTLSCSAPSSTPTPTPETPTPESSTPSPSPTSPPPTDTPTLPPSPTGTPTPVPPEDSLVTIPRGTLPCRSPQYWPYSLASSSVPIRVHYRRQADAPMATTVLELLETSWVTEMEILGFNPPLDDTGVCGPDGRFDAFLWEDIDTCYVDVVTDNPSTEWDDQITYMVDDPWGKYGGEILDSTLAHELNHACQAADDWWDAAIVYEMTSTFVEDAVFDDDNEYAGLMKDFQSRPDWPIDFNDSYVTWYMYGASLYFFYLNDRYYDGDFSFIAPMWRLMRNPPGADRDPTLNEPDFEDALDQLLLPHAGISYLDSVVEFARWRWYTGTRDDGKHFAEGALLGTDTMVPAMSVPITATAFERALTSAAPSRADAPVIEVEPDPAPAMLGTVYFDLEGTPGQADIGVTVTGVGPAVQLRVQALPGLSEGSDGDPVDLESPNTRVALTANGTRTLAITALPTGENDPDERTLARYSFTLRLTR